VDEYDTTSPIMNVFSQIRVEKPGIACIIGATLMQDIPCAVQVLARRSLILDAIDYALYSIIKDRANCQEHKTAFLSRRPDRDWLMVTTRRKQVLYHLECMLHIYVWNLR
jgi:hypothetical protein